MSLTTVATFTVQHIANPFAIKLMSGPSTFSAIQRDVDTMDIDSGTYLPDEMDEIEYTSLLKTNETGNMSVANYTHWSWVGAVNKLFGHSEGYKSPKNRSRRR